MNILLAFAPFLIFALTARFVGVGEGLAAGVIVSVGMLLRDVVQRKGLKILEVGTVVLFAGLKAVRKCRKGNVGGDFSFLARREA